MNRCCALVCLVVGSMTALACGGNVVVDSPATGGSPTTSSGTLGEGAGPTACPADPNDSDLMSLTDQPCETDGATCVAYDVGGCGNCTVTCGAGVWGAPDCEQIEDC